VKRLLFILGAVLAVELMALAWRSANPEWKAYQRAFVAAGIARAETEVERRWYREQRIGVREIRVDALGRVDRCTTCHLGIDDPNFVAAPEPFRAHSLILISHPPERFGCTICHNGRGRAVTTLAAHGDSAEAPSRLWRGVYLQAACFLCHGASGLPAEAVVTVLEGIKTVNQFRCLRCHQIRGEGESEGPDLSAVGSRRDWVEIYAHLLNPQAMSPGSTMPDFPLTRDQAEAITAYLLTLQGPGRAVYDARYLARDAERGVERGAFHVERSTSNVTAFRYEGRTLFRDLGCTYCHRVGTAGGEVGPELTHIGRVRDADWLRRLLRDPNSVLPGGTMPRLFLNDAQVEALVAYLVGLR
jgi:cbb3-type cytochrome oxidase cytochrome c subunit